MFIIIGMYNQLIVLSLKIPGRKPEAWLCNVVVDSFFNRISLSYYFKYLCILTKKKNYYFSSEATLYLGVVLMSLILFVNPLLKALFKYFIYINKMLTVFTWYAICRKKFLPLLLCRHIVL